MRNFAFGVFFTTNMTNRSIFFEREKNITLILILNQIVSNNLEFRNKFMNFTFN